MVKIFFNRGICQLKMEYTPENTHKALPLSTKMEYTPEKAGKSGVGDVFSFKAFF